MTWLYPPQPPLPGPHHGYGTEKKKRRQLVRATPAPLPARPEASAIGVAAPPHPRHKHIGIARVSGEPVYDTHRLAGMIDEHLLSGAIVLSQDQIQSPRPLAV